MEIILIAFAFITLLLFIVWLPFFKRTKESIEHDGAKHSLRDETNVELYKEHKAEIEKDFSDGAIDEENYQYLLAELDNSLLQDIAAAEKETGTPINTKQFGMLWPISLSLFIVAFSAALYIKQGTLENLMTTPVASNASQQSMSGEQQEQMRQQQMMSYIRQLQKHIDENPDDSEAWYNLGQTLVGAGEFTQAIAAFEQVIRIEGEHADLLGAIAQASYYKNNQQIDAQVQNLIDRALALDANDPSTNILLGMHNFIGQKYQQAIAHWQRVITANKQGVNIAALQEAINEAKSRLGMATNAVEGEPSQSPSQAATGPQIKVNVTLSTKIVEKLAQGEDKVVFVYALPINGKRIPLAAVKIMASDLPKVVTLNNSQAMSPDNNLASVEQVHVFAIISKQGGAGIKPGDFKGESHNVSVASTDTIHLVINELVE